MTHHYALTARRYVYAYVIIYARVARKPAPRPLLCAIYMTGSTIYSNIYAFDVYARSMDVACPLAAYAAR